MSIDLEAHVGCARLDGTRGVLGRIAEHHLVRVRVRVRVSLERTPTLASHHPNRYPHPHPNYHPNHHPSRHLGVADEEERGRQRRERGRGSEDGREARVRRVAVANVARGALDTRRHLGRHLRVAGWITWGYRLDHNHVGLQTGPHGVAPRRRLRRPGRRAARPCRRRACRSGQSI
eukprot:scaffold27162_cov57-Phaeocystis_antarctica.AAC.3